MSLSPSSSTSSLDSFYSCRARSDSESSVSSDASTDSFYSIRSRSDSESSASSDASDISDIFYDALPPQEPKYFHGKYTIQEEIPNDQKWNKLSPKKLPTLVGGIATGALGIATGVVQVVLTPPALAVSAISKRCFGKDLNESPAAKAIVSTPGKLLDGAATCFRLVSTGTSKVPTQELAPTPHEFQPDYDPNIQQSMADYFDYSGLPIKEFNDTRVLLDVQRSSFIVEVTAEDGTVTYEPIHSWNKTTNAMWGNEGDLFIAAKCYINGREELSPHLADSNHFVILSTGTGVARRFEYNDVFRTIARKNMTFEDYVGEPNHGKRIKISEEKFDAMKKLCNHDKTDDDDDDDSGLGAIGRSSRSRSSSQDDADWNRAQMPRAHSFSPERKRALPEGKWQAESARADGQRVEVDRYADGHEPALPFDFLD